MAENLSDMGGRHDSPLLPPNDSLVSNMRRFRVGGAMTSPTFRTGDNVEIIGPAEYGNTDHIGEKFEIETYHKEGPAFGGRDLYSACGFRWYPASSLRLVVASTGGDAA